MANLFDEAPEGQPESFVSGDFIQWKRSDVVDDYPTALYSALYNFRGINDRVNEFTVTSSKQTDHFLFSSSDTQGILPGDYSWQLEIIRDSDSARVVVDRGRITVRADLDTSNLESRTHSAIMLQKIESLLQGKADSDVAEYEIGGRSLKKLSFSELMEARNFYRGEVLREQQAEDAAQGRKGKATIQVRF